MDTRELIERLASPLAYPYPVEHVEVRQTHISIVFLAGPWVYKVKKPVRFDFLDFSTPDARRRDCDEEVRLNRRLAGDVYQGVVPITASGDRLCFEGDGEPIEWAVKMRRLPEHATVEAQLEAGTVDAGLIERLARRIAAFHASAPTTAETVRHGRWEAVAGNVWAVLRQARAHVGTTVEPTVLDRLETLLEGELVRLRSLIDARAGRGLVRDTHGDLHLGHVYHFPDREPPDDFLIIDCIEFSERLRALDPVADMAFLVMDLAFHGRRDLAGVFARAYFEATGDDKGARLLPLYSAYRACVRGMVDGLKHQESEVSPTDRQACLASSRAHWLLALGELEPACRRPYLLLIGGLPGSGKSTLARQLASPGHFDVVLRTDVVRKELAGLPADRPTPAGRRADLYAPEWSERTYAEVRNRAERVLLHGRRVLIDATFRSERRRREFLDLADRLRIPARLLVCAASAETIRSRLAGRRGDASDADGHTYEQLAAEWEPFGPGTADRARVIDTEAEVEEVAGRALAILDEG